MTIQPDWVSGFVDGEGTFYVGFNRQPDTTVGIRVVPEFRIVQHVTDVNLLYALKQFFGAGVVRKTHDDRYELRIRRLEHLQNIVIPFFEKHPLLTQKRFDVLKFKRIIRMIQHRKHLEKSGILELIDIAARMNSNDKRKILELRETLDGSRHGPSRKGSEKRNSLSGKFRRARMA